MLSEKIWERIQEWVKGCSMTQKTFREIEKNIQGLGLDMEGFYESSTSEELAVDFFLNNKHEFEGNVRKFVDSFDVNFRAKYANDSTEIKDIIFEIMSLGV